MHCLGLPVFDIAFSCSIRVVLISDTCLVWQNKITAVGTSLSCICNESSCDRDVNVGIAVNEYTVCKKKMRHNRQLE